MTNIKFKFLSYTTAFLMCLIEIIRTFIRPIYGKKEFGNISYILGWLPNYLAGLTLVLLGAMLMKEVIKNQSVTKIKKTKNSYMFMVAVLSLAGLILWEFEQKNRSLYYDKDDIYASIFGVICGYLLYRYLDHRKTFELDKIIIKKTNTNEVF
jgi:hypothetical protein